MQTPVSYVRWCIALLTWVLCAVLAWQATAPTPPARLSWDGASWWLSSHAGFPGHVRVRLDGQSVMLVTFEGLDLRPIWLWPTQAASPTAWGDFRRAVWTSQAEEVDALSSEGLHA